MCLILVLVLLISWSPVRVQASALPSPEVIVGTAHIIPFAQVWEPAALGLGGQVFGYVLCGLGVVLSAVQLVNAYNDFQEYSGLMDVSVYYYPDGTWSYGVDVGFIDRVRAFAFHRGYVVHAENLVTTVAEGELFGPFTAKVPCVVYQYSYHYVISGVYNVVSDAYLVSLIPGERAVSNGSPTYNTYIKSNEQTHYAKTVAHGVKRYSADEFDEFMSTASDFYHMGESGSLTLQDVFNKFGWTGIAGNGEVSIGQVAPLAVPLPEAYPEWQTNSRPATNPDTNEEVTVLPIPFNPSADPGLEPDVLTQPDIWQGSIADPMPDADTNPDTQPDIPGTPSSDIGDYQIDLKKFFPFCIPFDLYDFFMCLNADPVAPVIEWVIPLPGGGTYPLVIDLSAFDSVAQLLRRLQLLLFCVGLAFKTRDLIKG